MSEESNDSNAANASKSNIINGKIPWPGGPSFKQDFALPEPIMFYMANNPSSAKVYLKLIQPCKYFFETNPIIVAASFHEEEICMNETCDVFDPCEDPSGIKINIEQLKCKIWITNQLRVFDNTEYRNKATLLCPKLYRQCKIPTVYISYMDVLYDDFKFIVSDSKEVFLNETDIFCDNGKVVMLDEILESIPNVETFKCYANIPIVNASTMKNINELNNLKNLTSFGFYELEEIEGLDVEDLLLLFTNHESTKFVFHFGFVLGFTKEYRNKIDALIDTVIEREISNSLVLYDWQDQKKLKIMEKQHYNEKKK